jgi:uncharacterized membrane protein
LGNFLGLIYQNGTMTPLGTLDGSWSIAYAINDQNQIAGQAYTRATVPRTRSVSATGKS